jgi:hypothetical protein
MRIYLGIVLFLLFLLWAGYRLLIKRDLFQHKKHIQISLFFLSFWIVIYFLLLD